MKYTRDGYDTHSIFETVELTNQDMEDESGIVFYHALDASVTVDKKGLPHVEWKLLDNETMKLATIGEYTGDDVSFMKRFLAAHRTLFEGKLKKEGLKKPRIEEEYKRWHNRAMRSVAGPSELDLLEAQVDKLDEQVGAKPGYKVRVVQPGETLPKEEWSNPPTAAQLKSWKERLKKNPIPATFQETIWLSKVGTEAEQKKTKYLLSKFWTLRMDGKKYSTTSGKIGTKGVRLVRTFKTPNQMMISAMRLVDKKKLAGYHERLRKMMIDPYEITPPSPSHLKKLNALIQLESDVDAFESTHGVGARQKRFEIQRFELINKKSRKFWTIQKLVGGRARSFTVCFGRIPEGPRLPQLERDRGQVQTKTFKSASACNEAYEKLVEEKQKKGYKETGHLFTETL
jgi:predicted DNA-binding WGR domain protein